MNEDLAPSGPPILWLPTELFLVLAEWLEIPELLSLRRCSRIFLEVTQQRALWVSVLQRQQQYGLPLPVDLFPKLDDRTEEPLLPHLSARELEKLASQFHRVNRLWPETRPKETLHTFPHEDDSASLLGIQVLLDRWLLAIYAEGLIEIYDLDGMTKKTAMNLDHTGWGSYSAAVDESNKVIFIAITKTLPPFYLDVYKFDTNNGRLELVQRVHADLPKLVRAVEPSRRLVALSVSTKVELMRWDDASPSATPIPAYPEDLEDLWNGIIAIRFIGPFILIAKTRSLELHHYVPALQPNTKRQAPFKHYFEHRTFREVAFSYCRVAERSSYLQTLEITMLGSDVIQGLFQFLVKIHIPDANQPDVPHLEIELIGLYPLSLLIAPPPQASGSGMDTPTPATSHNHFLFGAFGQRAPSAVTRGFLSTFSIGPQGKRAIWVERARSSISREVQVWDHRMLSTASNEMQDSWTSHFGERCVEMEKNVVYKVASYDLRDDITHCTFAETTGIIVLGMRSGDIHVLPLLTMGKVTTD